MKLFGRILSYFIVVIAIFVILNVYSLKQASTLKTNSDNIDINGVGPTLELVNLGKSIENIRVQMLTALTFENASTTSIALENLDTVPTHSNTSAETQLSAVEEISAASDSLALLSEQLQHVIKHFKLA